MAETRKLAAILVSDIVGYSRLAGADEDRILARLRALRSDLIDPIISVHHGRIVKRTGDGSIIEFRSIVDAVRCAIEVQNGMAARNAGVPADERIEYRVGVHLGDVVEESDGDLMGDGVNIASRLEGLSEPGGLCLSGAAFEQVRDRLKETFADLGEKQLKNIARPMRVYGLSAAAIAASGAAGVSVRRGRRPRSSSAATIAAALVGLLIVVVGGAWWLLNAKRPAGVATKTPAEAAHFSNFSIVVLPFANLSGDPKQEYLVDALTDELTTGLARIRDTFVIARNTAMTFKGKPVDAKAIGKELGVRYVLEGSVEPSGDQMRVNAQLIDAGSGAHLWAEQFDTPRADVLQTQDSIVTHLAAAMDFQLKQAEAARLKLTPPAKSDAVSLAVQCDGGMWRARYIGKEADAAFALCEQALAIDPNNVRALQLLGIKFYGRVGASVSGDPKGDLERADQLETKALALDPDNTWAHLNMGNVRRMEGRIEESIAEAERALALAPSNVDAFGSLGWDDERLGEFGKSLEYFDKAIKTNPYSPSLYLWYGDKAVANFGLKNYDQAIDWARRAIAIRPDYVPSYHATLVAALALTGHDAEAREALKRYLALPSTERLKTIAAWKAFYNSEAPKQGDDPRFVELTERMYDGLRKAGMPEE